jgi:hypothetical protein
MAQKSFEDQIKEYDKRKDMHYYVYFSIATYTHQVNAIQFKKKSDLNEFYKNKKYFSTYLAAQQAADKLNAKDTNIGHMFGRASREFEHKLQEILEMEGMTPAQKCAVEAAQKNAEAITMLINNEKF